MNINLITGSIIKSEATYLPNSDGDSCNRLKINGINNETYLIATKTIPSTFGGKLWHLVSLGNFRYTELTYLDSSSMKETTILVNKSSLIKRLHHAGISNDDITKALQPSMYKEGVALSKFISDISPTLLKQISIATRFAQKSLLTKDRQIDIFQYWADNKEDLIKQAQANGGSVRIRPSESDLSRTLLVTHENGVTKAFVIFNRMTQLKDKSIGSGGCKTKINLCYELTEGKWATHTSLTDQTAFLKEIAPLKQCQGIPNVLQLMATDTYTSHKTGKTKYSIITEYCDKGELFDSVAGQSFKKLFSTEDKRNQAYKDLAIALREVHRKGLIHRDIKLENIFVIEENGELKLVLADFGLSYEKTNETERRKKCGTPSFVCPEVAAEVLKTKKPLPKNMKLDEHIDIWALGAVFYLIFHDGKRDLPWVVNDQKKSPEENSLATMKKLKLLHDKASKGQCAFTKPHDETSFEYLIWNMLQADPNEQWSLDQVIEFLEKNS